MTAPILQAHLDMMPPARERAQSDALEHITRLVAFSRARIIERALIENIERGVRYLRVPVITGGGIQFIEYDTHELDGDATGVK